MKRKCVAVLLASVLALSMAGCGSTGTAADPPPDTAPAATPSPSPEPTPTPTPRPAPTPNPILSAVTVELIGKDVLWTDAYAGRYSDEVTFDFNYTNNTEKDIRGFQGDMTFYDMFGDEIITISFEDTETVPAGSAMNQPNLYLEVNEFLPEDVKLRDTKFEDMTMEFKATKIIFSDGSVMEK